MNILTSKYSKESAIGLGEELDCAVYNPYSHEFYRGSTIERGVHYNMGCSSVPFRNVINQPAFVYSCVDKTHTFTLLEQKGVLICPWTRSRERAQEWLNSDRIVVNRATVTGKANEGLSYSYKGLDGQPDIPLEDRSVIWTRYVNHTRELRVYTFKGKAPLVFEKFDVNGGWYFEPIRASNKLIEQMTKAQEAFSGLVFSAYDVLECVTGDYYTLENNSAPSLLVHDSIIPRLTEVIENELGRS